MIRLHYWFSRIGRAEQIRLTLAELGLEWEEVDTEWGSDAWRALQWDVLWFGAQPALVDGSFTVVQSGVILAYLARKHRIAPTDLQGSTSADAFAWAAEDLRMDLFRTRRDEAKLATFIERTWPERWLGALHHHLARSGTGFLVGDRLTHADIAWWDALDQARQLVPALTLPAGSLVESFVASIGARPRLAAYLASERRPPAED
jgi:glutathione S-transferase